MIQQHRDVKRHHVPTCENPADLGSWGGSVINKELWKHGPAWLSDPPKWPPAITLEACSEAEKEMKATRSILATAVRVRDELDELLEANTLRKMHRVGCRDHGCRDSLTTAEIRPGIGRQDHSTPRRSSKPNTTPRLTTTSREKSYS